MWYIDIPLFSLSLSVFGRSDKNDKKNEKKGVKKKVSMTMIKKRMNLSFMTKNEIVSNTMPYFFSPLSSSSNYVHTLSHIKNTLILQKVRPIYR